MKKYLVTFTNKKTSSEIKTEVVFENQNITRGMIVLSALEKIKSLGEKTPNPKNYNWSHKEIINQ